MSRPFGKIDTLFERDADFNVIPTRLRRPLLGTISKWVVTEKVDGTNIRLAFRAPETSGDEYTFTIGGRSDNAQIHAGLYHHLDELAHRIQPEVVEMMTQNNVQTFTFYGEGYGEKIQNGGRYRKGQGFILFDILVNDQQWLSDDDITGIASSLDIPRVPIIGEMSLGGIVEYVRWGFQSMVAETDMAAEGIVARPVEPLYDNRGRRLVIKLKTSDFTHPTRNVVRLPDARDGVHEMSPTVAA